MYDVFMVLLPPNSAVFIWFLTYLDNRVLLKLLETPMGDDKLEFDQGYDFNSCGIELDLKDFNYLSLLSLMFDLIYYLYLLLL